MTPMPASPFMNSGAHVPEAPGSAAADQVAPQVAAAEPIADPDGGYMGPRLSPALGTSVGTAATISAASSDNLGCLTAEDEALYWQLRRADNPFTRDLPDVPDAHALFDAIEPPPLFLQRQA